MKRARHRAAVIDRGAEHIHRYTAACSCGWIGVHRRQRADARAVWAGHAAGEAKRARPDRRGMAPRPVTAEADLPESLRSATGTDG